MACNLLSKDNSTCIEITAGIYTSYAIGFDDITGVTYDVNGVVTAITVSGATKLVKHVFDDDEDSAYYNQTGERPTAKKHDYVQESFYKFAGLGTDTPDFANGLSQCCGGIVLFHFFNSETNMVQGIVETATGWKATKTKGAATVSIISDVPSGEERTEVKVNSKSTSASALFTMTMAELDLLM